MPANVEDGILKGMYKFASKDVPHAKHRAQLLGSGPAMQAALRAADILAEKFQVASDVWSVTSYKELRREALEVERWNVLHPDSPPKTCYVQQMLGQTSGPIVAVSDYMHLVAEQIAKWLPRRITTLGTDGFGRSESREALRRHFEVDAEHVVFATLSTLVRDGQLDRKIIPQAIKTLGIDPEKPDPVKA
jgi:pyruvate dehydrogenase E1 component